MPSNLPSHLEEKLKGYLSANNLSEATWRIIKRISLHDIKERLPDTAPVESTEDNRVSLGGWIVVVENNGTSSKPLVLLVRETGQIEVAHTM